MAAHLRYNGHLYSAGRSAIARAIEPHLDVVVLSGGYGVLHPLENVKRTNSDAEIDEAPYAMLNATWVNMSKPPFDDCGCAKR